MSVTGGHHSRAEDMAGKISDGLVHTVPPDLKQALTATREIADLWEDLTPIARNEFICRVEDAKREKTRVSRISRTVEELLEGKKRPCCWVGCIHRTDKKPGKWQQAVLIDGKARNK
jgi:Bacteriocin-protection, YdeI or OmpD-Associated